MTFKLFMTSQTLSTSLCQFTYFITFSVGSFFLSLFVTVLYIFSIPTFCRLCALQISSPILWVIFSFCLQCLLCKEVKKNHVVECIKLFFQVCTFSFIFMVCLPFLSSCFDLLLPPSSPYPPPPFFPPYFPFSPTYSPFF